VKRREIVVRRGPLDRAIAAACSEIDTREARRLIEAGLVFVDGKRCVEARRVAEGARIVIHSDAPENRTEALRILYEDADLIAVDKRPGQHVNETETSSVLSLVEQLREKDARVVHRLDRETSGVVVLAKGSEMAEVLSRAFRERRTKKTYLAIAAGSVDDGLIDLPIADDKRRTRAQCVSARGKPAQTEVRTIARKDGLSSLELHPITGRTHQIRVHLSHLGAPIAGDTLYGGPLKVRIGEQEIAISRVLLHASALAMPVRGKTLEFFSPIPEEMRRIAEAGLPLEPVFS
jgi:RluA family pseudouridine synthase